MPAISSLKISIIFEDEAFLVIEKPSGLVVNRADTTGKAETIQDWAEIHLSLRAGAKQSVIKDEQRIASSFTPRNDIEVEFLSRSGIVHRLDKDTSGLLVIAKTPGAFENLKNQFKERTTVKKYLALVHGAVEPPSGKINAPIARSPYNRMHFGIFPGGREAITEYRVIKLLSYKVEKYSLLELIPHTGRTHQIRVHMKYINHPVVSDPIYGGRKNYQNDLEFCPRLFLHAFYLKLNHPLTGKVLEFESELAMDLNSVLLKNSGG